MPDDQRADGSRSGVTIVAGLTQRLSYRDASRFAQLIAALMTVVVTALIRLSVR